MCIEEEKPKFPLLANHAAPVRFVKQFLTKRFIEQVTFQTNLYNIQRSTEGYEVAVKKRRSSNISHKKVAPVSTSEIKKLFGIILYMGIHKLPNQRLYWSSKTCVPFIADSMPRNRFNEVMSILHFNDNKLCQTDN